MRIKNDISFYLIAVTLSFYQSCFSQTTKVNTNSHLFFTPEILIGKTMEANTHFPETQVQYNLFFSIGRYNFDPRKEWAARLNFPKTGVSFGYTDFGNTDKIGRGYSILPFMEFSILKRQIEGLNLQIGFGSSYLDTQYHPETNKYNRAITTKINWSCRSFVYYDIFKKNTVDWRIGIGYLHHSNGHTRLPNQGLNTFAASISAQFDAKPKPFTEFQKPSFTSKSQTYLSYRLGLGQNVLSEEFNSKKEVFTFSVSAGKIINNTFKFGGGFYYRFYEHYYDYIKNNETLVEEQYPNFRDNPLRYATAFGVFVSSELLMDHIGFEFDLGFNIHKPFYKIDWKLNQGYIYESNNGKAVEVLGELTSYYKIKRSISARMGLKYYLWTTNKAPKHNVFVGAHINSNLGQADFSELSLGYVYRINLNKKLE